MWLKNLLMIFVLIFVSSAFNKFKYRTVEDDMLVTDQQFEWLFSNTSSRNALLPEEYHWPNGIVYYKYGSKFSSSRKKLILDAMAKISERSCVRFVLAPKNLTKYVNILKPQVKVCATAVGYQKKVQPMRLADPCMKLGVIQHEILHSLGFFHEQSDPDRDKYVSIYFKNIKEEKKRNFQKYSHRTVGSLSTGYDYQSVMHYGPYYFSKNGKATIQPLQSGVTIGQRRGLSETDFLKINLLYKCKNQTKSRKNSVNKREKGKSRTIRKIKKILVN